MPSEEWELERNREVHGTQYGGEMRVWWAGKRKPLIRATVVLRLKERGVRRCGRIVSMGGAKKGACGQ